MMGIMNEIASGTELAIFMLVVISAHLLPQNRLMFDKFSDPMGEKAVNPISAATCFAPTFAELQFSLLRQVGSSFIIYQIDTHVQYFIRLYVLQ